MITIQSLCKTLLLICVLSLPLSLGGCSSSKTTSSHDSSRTYQHQRIQTHGQASYYAHRFHGRTTANGEKFNMNAMTAAHKKLKFGTRVRVTNKANGKSVIVRINDRGPYAKGRIIDVSYAAAKKLGMVRSGTAKVKLEIVR